MAFSQQHARASKDKWTPLFSLSLSLSLSFVSFFCSLSLSLSSPPHTSSPPTRSEGFGLCSSPVAPLVSSRLLFRRLLSSLVVVVSRSTRAASLGVWRSEVLETLEFFFSFFFSFFLSFLFFSFFSFFFLFFFFLKKSIQNRFFLSVSLVYFSCVFFQVSKMKFVKKNKKIGFFKRIISFVSNGSEGKQGERKTKENRRKLFVNRLPFSERKRG